MAFASACGGNEFASGEDGDGSSSGGTASGGSAGTTGGGSGGGAGSGQGGSGGVASSCPGDIPAGPCPEEGMECSYGECCPTRAVCEGGEWSVSISACPEPACPPEAPIDGADCSCSIGLSCMFVDCESSGMMAQGTCGDDGTWDITVGPCGPTVGNCYGSGISCGPGELCTKQDNPNGGRDIACVPNLCWPNELSCDCAGPACPEAHMCNYVNPWDGSSGDPGHMWCAL